MMPLEEDLGSSMRWKSLKQGCRSGVHPGAPAARKPAGTAPSGGVYGGVGRGERGGAQVAPRDRQRQRRLASEGGRRRSHIEHPREQGGRRAERQRLGQGPVASKNTADVQPLECVLLSGHFLLAWDRLHQPVTWDTRFSDSLGCFSTIYGRSKSGDKSPHSKWPLAVS